MHRATFEDLYLVFELLDADLEKILKTPQALTPQHTQVFIFQLLCALAHIHSYVSLDISQPLLLLITVNMTEFFAYFVSINNKH